MNQKIDCSRIKVGVVFSEPVYFDDGQNMFLAKNRPAKPYHVAALKRWKIPFLLTVGHEINGTNQSGSKNFSVNQSSAENQNLQNKTDSSNSFNDSDVAELEDFEEL